MAAVHNGVKFFLKSDICSLSSYTTIIPQFLGDESTCGYFWPTLLALESVSISKLYQPL